LFGEEQEAALQEIFVRGERHADDIQKRKYHGAGYQEQYGIVNDREQREGHFLMGRHQ
jgi:hypothetical protein